MKKTALLLCIFIIACSLLSCSVYTNASGIEVWVAKPWRAQSGIDRFFAEDDTSIISNYSPLSSGYHHNYKKDIAPGGQSETERFILYATYNQTDYASVKEYCEAASGGEAYKNVGNYRFFTWGGMLDGERYQLKLVAYNDMNKTVVLVGFHVSGAMQEQYAEDLSDFESFLNKYYGDVFSFYR